MREVRFLPGLTIVALAALFWIPSFSAVGQQLGILGEWKTVEVPPAPELKAVKIEPTKTVLLVMDFTQEACSADGAHPNPRCLAAIPKVKALLDKARAHKMLVVFSQGLTKRPGTKELAPIEGEQVLVARPNKFDETDLDKILKDKGITNVIVTGTAPNGAVLFTAYGAAARGYQVIAPVDTMPGASVWAEITSIWGISHNPTVGPASTLTSVDLIAF